MSAPPRLLVSTRPGAPPLVGLFARPDGPALEICAGEPDPAADPFGEDARPLFALSAEAAGDKGSWSLGESEDGAPAWIESVTGATVKLWLGEDGFPRCELSLKRGAWIYRTRGCSPMMGPFAKSDTHRARPVLSHALKEQEHIQGPNEAFVLASDALTLRFDSEGRDRAPVFTRQGFDELGSEDAEFAFAWINSLGRGTIRLGLNFSGQPAPAVFPETLAGAKPLDLPGLGVEWALPANISPKAALAWAEAMAEEEWPGGVAAFPSEESLSALGDDAKAKLRSLGFEPRVASQPRRLFPKGVPKIAVGAEIARTALEAFRPSLAKPARPMSAFLDEQQGHNLADLLAVGALAPGLFVEAGDLAKDGTLATPRERLPKDERKPWIRAARFRMAFLPYLAHLRARELEEGLPMVRPIGLAPGEGPASEQWQPHFFLGEDVFVAGAWPRQGERRPRATLPPGEWLDYYTGARFMEDRPLDIAAEPMPGQALIFLRAGSALPLFDLGVAAPFGTGSRRRPGPGGHLALKIAPRGERESTFRDVFAPAGAPAGAKLSVSVEQRLDGVSLRVRAWGPRRLTLMLKSHRPARVLCGFGEREMAPLPCLQKESEFAMASDCWHFHALRDELLAKADLPGPGESALFFRIDDLE